jgi:hypothetical protein
LKIRDKAARLLGESLFLLAVQFEGKDMPSIERLALGSLDGEGSCLITEEPPCFGHIEVLEPGHLEFVEVNNMGLECGGSKEAEEGCVEDNCGADSDEAVFDDEFKSLHCPHDGGLLSKGP